MTHPTADTIPDGLPSYAVWCASCSQHFALKNRIDQLCPVCADYRVNTNTYTTVPTGSGTGAIGVTA